MELKDRLQEVFPQHAERGFKASLAALLKISEPFSQRLVQRENQVDQTALCRRACRRPGRWLERRMDRGRLPAEASRRHDATAIDPAGG